MTVQRRIENGRLAYYCQKADADFWDTHWETSEAEQLYEWARNGISGPPVLQDIYQRYLPRNESIIEAGCGIGQVVMALFVHGYHIEGVEWATKTVERVNKRFPELQIRVGDVTALEVPNETYGAYISLGVVEHRRDGPEPFLHEAYRILRPGGIALISVPYLHPLRRLKGHLGLYRGEPNDLPFYQYAFSRKEIVNILQQTGFEVINHTTYEGLKGIKDEIRLVSRALRSKWLGPTLNRRIRRSLFLETHFGHMIMTVSRKPET